MGGRQGSVSTDLEVDADAVFAARHRRGPAPRVERPHRGPRVPAGELGVGDRWTVRVHLPGKRFASVSEVLELDRGERRFVHRSKPDDDNPSHTVWTWTVEPAGPGACTVHVSWSLEPRTASRRLVARDARAGCCGPRSRGRSSSWGLRRGTRARA